VRQPSPRSHGAEEEAAAQAEDRDTTLGRAVPAFC